MKFCFRLALAAFLLAIIGAPVPAKPPKMRDIADTIANNPILSSFASMITAADQGTFLSSRGPFTVFVPTDSAFAKLPPGTLDTLLRPENHDRLLHIVLFHVVNNRKFTTKDLASLRAFFSCEGNPLIFHRTHTGAQLVSKGKIVHGDIHCANGVIHEVDTLLMPPDGALPPIAAPPPAGATPVTNAPVVTTNAAPVVPSDSSQIPVAQPATNAP
jgi:uncharacterized surface protein with fasciclin (FAS1) repeats